MIYSYITCVLQNANYRIENEESMNRIEYIEVIECIEVLDYNRDRFFKYFMTFIKVYINAYRFFIILVYVADVEWLCMFRLVKW